MIKVIAIVAALTAPMCAHANEISDYIQQEIAGVYSVYKPGARGQQSPMRLDYVDGDFLALEQDGIHRLLPIHTIDSSQGAVNLLEPSGGLATLTVQFGYGKMVFDNGSQLSLTFVRKLTDIDYAALRGIAGTPAPRPAQAPLLVPSPHEIAAPEASAAPAPVAIKASFDCAKASTMVEGMICGNATLAELDLRTAEAYKSLRNAIEDPGALKSEQINWLKGTRNACKTLDCLVDAYTTRAEDLEQMAQYLSKPAEFR